MDLTDSRVAEQSGLYAVYQMHVNIAASTPVDSTGGGMVNVPIKASVVGVLAKLTYSTSRTME